ncbi:hypothetical protein CMT20_12435 [Elizabethkingia anophelis]|nr:hypothetical protein [Elizabethkingia anophelis]MDV4112610.1 hypothetical protein [Elizabethkingia anophelis]
MFSITFAQSVITLKTRIQSSRSKPYSSTDWTVWTENPYNKILTIDLSKKTLVVSTVESNEVQSYKIISEEKLDHDKMEDVTEYVRYYLIEDKWNTQKTVDIVYSNNDRYVLVLLKGEKIENKYLAGKL